MKGKWTEVVKSELPGNYFHNPREHGLEDPKNYTRWDLGMISRSDVVLAYMDSLNPSGIGLALEVGFARGMGIPVVLVVEKGVINQKHWEIVKQASDFFFEDLSDAVVFLRGHLGFIPWGPRDPK